MILLCPLTTGKLKGSPSYKYLGVEIDETLSWRNHTDSLCKKVSAGIGAIKRVRHLVPRQTLHQMYHALVEPYLEYCCEVWGAWGYVNVTGFNSYKIERSV